MMTESMVVSKRETPKCKLIIGDKKKHQVGAESQMYGKGSNRRLKPRHQDPNIHWISERSIEK